MNYKHFIVLTFSVLILISCSSNNPLLNPEKENLTVKSPEKFQVKFETSKGNFIIEAKREYSPLAVDRFYYLVKNNYYNGNKFFRVVPNFVVQWGMKGIPEIDSTWEKLGVADEPVKLSNTIGTVAFARGGPKSRSNQLYINLGNNTRLDSTKYNGVNGFPAFGKVIKGLDVVKSINPEYKQEPNQDSIMIKGNNYLNKNFPNLDYIITAEIINQ